MLQRADFDNDTVAWWAQNPSQFGYHHGPIPYATRDLPPHDEADAPEALAAVSRLNTGVCDVDMGAGEMCGMTFMDGPSLWRHFRTQHPGATAPTRRVTISVDESTRGRNAIKKWVLTGGWRNARYVVEPGRGPRNGILDMYASACEAIARQDQQFAAKFGTKFHRHVIDSNPNFLPRRARQQRTRQVTGAARYEVALVAERLAAVPLETANAGTAEASESSHEVIDLTGDAKIKEADEEAAKGPV